MSPRTGTLGIVSFSPEAVHAAVSEAWEEGAIWAAMELGAITSPEQPFLVPSDNPYTSPVDELELSADPYDFNPDYDL